VNVAPATALPYVSYAHPVATSCADPFAGASFVDMRIRVTCVGSTGVQFTTHTSPAVKLTCTGLAFAGAGP